MVNYRRFWDRDTLSVSHFLLWTAAAATYLSVAAAAGGGKARVRTSTDITRISLSSSSTNIKQSNTGVSSLGQTSSMRDSIGTNTQKT
ncbi:hypothetical protein F5879DRAFT_994662 [Lentinula edodes]|nr:hypothetical protein F5879DRAFT_994662 [Lentinula edodes]